MRYKSWRTNLKATGEKLQDETGRVMKGTGTNLAVSDGPYAESKEVIGGFFIIEANDYDHAVELCRDCPAISISEPSKSARSTKSRTGGPTVNADINPARKGGDYQ